MKAMACGLALRAVENRFLLMGLGFAVLMASLGACDDPFEGM